MNSWKRLLSITLLACACELSAHAAALTFSFKVDNVTTVQVERTDAKHITLRMVPGGKIQQLDIDAPDTSDQESLEAADYNFDGYKDLAISVPVGMVNSSYQIYLYEPATSRFVALAQPAEKIPAANCDDLSEIKLKPAEHVLISSCRSGPAWYTDAYRYRADGRLYLYQTDRLLSDDDVLAALKGGKNQRAANSDPSLFVITYDEHGQAIAESIQDYEGDMHSNRQGDRVTITVGADRLPLYEDTSEQPTRRYLVKGDVAEVVDVNELWLKINYHRPQKGVVSGWVKATDIGAQP